MSSKTSKETNGYSLKSQKETKLDGIIMSGEKFALKAQKGRRYETERGN